MESNYKFKKVINRKLAKKQLREAIYKSVSVWSALSDVVEDLEELAENFPEDSSAKNKLLKSVKTLSEAKNRLTALEYNELSDVELYLTDGKTTVFYDN